MFLQQPYTFNRFCLPHRIVMAPMTRSRSTQPGNIPNEIMATYYAQRAKHAAFIITEATQISEQGQGYSFTPGIHSQEQIAGWKLITNAVHQQGGRIFLQLWHVGRLSHEMFHKGQKPVAPSAITPNARIWAVNKDNPNGTMLTCPQPRALTKNEIQNIINDFRQASINAIEANFDGVEIHGANGYLIDQFMRRTSNTRNDTYGGSIENRVRFMLEIAHAITTQIGAHRTGIRLAPFIKQRGTEDNEEFDAVLYAAKQLNKIGLTYIHIAEADWEGNAPQIPDDFRSQLRHTYNGTIIVAGNYTQEKAEILLEKHLIDLVAFGRHFIANPDYPKKLFQNLPLNTFDANKLFGGNEKGYTDYTTL